LSKIGNEGAKTHYYLSFEETYYLFFELHLPDKTIVYKPIVIIPSIEAIKGSLFPTLISIARDVPKHNVIVTITCSIKFMVIFHF
jgi:hypothetical protein